MSYFGESPLERIVDVHWKKKDGDPPNPGDDNNPPYCGRYGYGAVVGGPSALPFGPNAFIPMVGSFSTTKGDPVYGGLTYPKTAMLNPVDMITAYPAGLHATFILLQASNIVFSNVQLNGIVDFQGNLGHFNWTVPMATGQSADGIPMVIKSYTIRMEWSRSFVEISPPPGTYGLGMSHPTLGTSPPREPFMILGSTQGGSASYTYDFKVKEWYTGQATGDTHDPNVGGNAILWWMERHAREERWSATTHFMDTTLIVENDWYTWEIIGNCQPFPNLFE